MSFVLWSNWKGVYLPLYPENSNKRRIVLFIYRSKKLVVISILLTKKWIICFRICRDTPYRLVFIWSLKLQKSTKKQHNQILATCRKTTQNSHLRQFAECWKSQFGQFKSGQRHQATRAKNPAKPCKIGVCGIFGFTPEMPLSVVCPLFEKLFACSLFHIDNTCNCVHCPNLSSLEGMSINLQSRCCR